MKLTSNFSIDTQTKFVYPIASPLMWRSSDVWQQYPKAIRLIAGGLINLKPLVTHCFKLEEAVQAFHVAADPSQGAIKVQILD
jgi:threonine dehydrogenase-like Zn-dependent dehydrogenase